MPILLLDAEHQLRLGPVVGVGHLIQVLHILLILPHAVHLLQHVLGPDMKTALTAIKCQSSDVTPGYESVGRLVIIHQSVREPLGSQELLD